MSNNSHLNVNLLILLQLHLIKLDLGIRAISSLLKLLYIKFFYFSKIVF
jgi:hypothetical protein